MMLASLILWSSLVTTPPASVTIALPGNMSEVDGVLSNPNVNWQRKSADLALSDMAESLKAKNIQVSFVEYDYGNSKTRTLETAQAITKTNAIAVIGYNNSSDALLAGRILQDAQIPLIVPTATADRIEELGRYVRRICFDDSFQGRIMADFAWKDQNVRKVGIITVSDCAYCQSLRQSFKTKFLSNGGEIVADELILTADTDFTALAKKLKEAKQMDAIFVPNYEGTAARLLPQLIDQGVTPKMWLAGDGWGITLELFHKVIGRRTYQAYAIAHWRPNVGSSVATKFHQNFLARYKIEPNDTAVLTYDAVRLVLQALLKAKDLSREGLILSLEQLGPFEGVTGTISYPTGRRTPQKPAVILKLQDQKTEIVKTISEGASAP